MENVQDIAKWFLSHAPMTYKKVQKLCYYAQAWYCALYDGSPLFDDRIEAWVHGPVVISLYPIYSDYYWNDIPKEENFSMSFCEKVQDVLDAVYNTYSGLSDTQLESLARAEDP